MTCRLTKHLLENDTLIVIGETGSGKTTQIPQFLYHSRLGERGTIAVTQPRRVAAISISTRVAKEMKTTLGDVVGYTVRFEDHTSRNTKIKFVTDGSLLREALSDRLLRQYSVIILDEAHERTINTDVLFGIVKDAQKTRKNTNHSPLKVSSRIRRTHSSGDDSNFVEINAFADHYHVGHNGCRPFLRIFQQLQNHLLDGTHVSSQSDACEGATSRLCAFVFVDPIPDTRECTSQVSAGRQSNLFRLIWHTKYHFPSSNPVTMC